MRDGIAAVCWAPECANPITQSPRGRPQLYCSGKCRVRAVRRNGGTAPTEPYSPFEPTPLQQDATAATVGSGSEQQSAKQATANTVTTLAGQGSSDADVLGRVAPGNVTPPVATGGKAPAPVQPPPEVTPLGASVRPPERADAPPLAPQQRSSDTGAVVEDLGGQSGVQDSSGSAQPEAEPTPAQVTQLHVAITEDSTVPVKIVVHPMVAAYKADVAKLGKANDRQGLQVIEMAEKLVSSATSPAAAANLSKELQRLMDALEESSNDALVNQDPSLIIRDRTLAKLREIQEASAASA